MRITTSQLRRIIMEEFAAAKRQRRAKALRESAKRKNLLKVRRQRAARLQRERIFESKYGRRRSRRLNESRYGHGLLGAAMDVLMFKFKATLGILGIAVLLGVVQDLRDSGNHNPTEQEVRDAISAYCEQNNIPETSLETQEIDEICAIAQNPDAAVTDYDAALDDSDVAAAGGGDFVPGGMSSPDAPISDDFNY